MPRYRAVLFDFFGTLTRCVRRGSAHTAIANLLGCPAEQLINLLDRTFYLRASGQLGGAEATMRWLAHQAGVAPSDATLRALVAARNNAVLADTQLRADAVATLRALRARGVRTGLISDCTYELPAFLPKLAIAPLLDTSVFSVEVGCCKPDQAIYLAACRRLDLEPTDCLYVGDGGSQELSGAERVGMAALRLTAPDLSEHLVFNADRRWQGPDARSLAEVLDVVDSAGADVPAGAGADVPVGAGADVPVGAGAARPAGSRSAARSTSSRSMARSTGSRSMARVGP